MPPIDIELITLIVEGIVRIITGTGPG